MSEQTCCSPGCCSDSTDRTLERIRGARPEDREAVERLLDRAGLPIAEVDRWLADYRVAEARDGVVGVAGVENHGSDGVLRSVAVAEPWRGLGLGHRLVAAALDRARELGLRRLWLLTTTAADYFPRHGFRRTSRDEAPEEIRESVEFREACPASAVAMVADLQGEGPED